ncbi:MAG: hypothetical protein CMJ35_10300 [Phycisphaerae bacterium]|nr:hypothetical protein [Phycisphaerae bacterium]MBM91987.1 hypothetical protein [Phycisphaerae bacterium]HCT43899.1 hypothetical protein [Phycisphaerales bacterium]
MRFVRTLALGLMLLLLSTSAQAQGTPASNAFTFQGHLRYNGMPADVQLSATFRLFPTLNGTDDPVSDEITRTFTPDSEGRFSVLLDFGETFNGYRIFNGDERYMQIILLDPPGGLEEDIPLSPRARLAATPMAAYALNARITPLAEITDNHLVSTDELGSLSLNLDDDDLGLTIRPSGGSGALFSYTGIQATDSFDISSSEGGVSLVANMGDADLVSTQGDIDISAAQGNISMLSDAEFSLVTNNSTMKTDPGGYTLNALNIDLESDASTNINAGASVSINAAATLTLSSAFTTINGNQFDGVNAIFNDNILATANALKPGGGPWGVLSDARHKKNITPLHGSLDTLLALRPVQYEYNNPKERLYVAGVQTGFVAQEVQMILPDWVDESPDGTLILTPRGFEAMVVDAMQELQHLHNEQVEALQAENDELRARLDRLESIMLKMQSAP